ncbi:MAG: SpoVA/SpoVAEb family sporulation membrane protein [Clostridiales bacterium]|jgi:stage V sporulation protein AC|nr:SpoVA/SpoVAEb family sporulation membrane protein [Clostridiales bacterium]
MTQSSENTRKRNERYDKYVKAVTPQSSVWRSLWRAFFVGGLTCILAQGFADLYRWVFPSWTADMVGNLTSVTVISLAILLTGLGIFDKIAKVGGAGSFLPITGFANAMASASMEFKSEGLIFGTSAKMFSVVGPVIVNGVVWSTVAGLIHFVIGFFM